MIGIDRGDYFSPHVVVNIVLKFTRLLSGSSYVRSKSLHDQPRDELNSSRIPLINMYDLVDACRGLSGHIPIAGQALALL